jgi:hypothetical protein
MAFSAGGDGGRKWPELPAQRASQPPLFTGQLYRLSKKRHSRRLPVARGSRPKKIWQNNLRPKIAR